jgi:hypothetical protein
VKIAYERSGGFAGLRKRAFVDTDTLTASERGEWERLVDAAQFFRLPSTIPPSKPQGRDMFIHVIRVEVRGAQHQVQVTGTPDSEPLRALIARLGTVAH